MDKYENVFLACILGFTTMVTNYIAITLLSEIVDGTIILLNPIAMLVIAILNAFVWWDIVLKDYFKDLFE